MSRRSTKHTLLLLALAGGMFGFAFALVPLYNVFCEITGINGKTSDQAALLEEIDRPAAGAAREVRIGLLADVARGMPWEFRPLEETISVRSGEMTTTAFLVRNRSHKSITGQAVPSVSPGQAARYLRKLECFCFEQQELAAGEELEMSVSFILDAGMPADIEELTLSYTMFFVSENADTVAHNHE